MASLPAETQPLSVKSGRVKAARRLARRASRAEARRFLAEGPQAVREALDLPGCVEEVFALRGADGAHPDIRARAADHGVAWHLVDDAALASLAETVHPQGLVAVCRFIDRPLVDVLPQPSEEGASLVAVCADVRDPGN